MNILENDYIKLGFNFFNLKGLVDLSSVNWLPAKITPLLE